MIKPDQNICVYCGSGPGKNPIYMAAARSLGRAMVEAGIGLVYGGGSLGLMGEVAKTVLEAGGHVTGIIPEFLGTKERMLTGVNELIVTKSMHERKMSMFEHSTGFVALPGGIGTLEGFLEILTWGQLRIHNKPCGVLNVAGYFDLLIGFLDHAVKEGFLTDEHRRMIMVESDPAKLLERMGQYAPAEGERLMGRTHR